MIVKIHMLGFGITQEGHSVLCNVTGFIHYFYCPVPKGFEENLTEFTNYLKATFDGIERVEITSKESIWGIVTISKLHFSKYLRKQHIQNKICFPKWTSTQYRPVHYL